MVARQTFFSKHNRPVSSPTQTFPAGFLWGTGTAAHQVEGDNPNCDWWDWEQRGGNVKNGDSSRVACDWWHGRYREDFVRARALGQNSHRLSIEWSRLEPRQGEWSHDALQTYREMLTYLRKLDMRPLVTLHHFTNPRWLAAKGGWENPHVVQWFRRYAEWVVEELGDLCDFWLTLNEPNAYATLSYCAGLWPPQKKGVLRALKVATQMVRAHAAAYDAMKQVQPNAQIGIAHRFQVFLPARPERAADRWAARLRDQLFNQPFLRAVETGSMFYPDDVPAARGTQDFLGVNYYFSEGAAFDPRAVRTMFTRRVVEPAAARQEPIFAGVGNIDPSSFERLLKQLAGYRKPIYITENGIFETDATNQSRYMVAHLNAVRCALAAGADVRGYYWWTLVDNFEWSEGYAPRFGLVQLDRSNQTRRNKPVAELYARIAHDNYIAPALAANYALPIW